MSIAHISSADSPTPAMGGDSSLDRGFQGCCERTQSWMRYERRFRGAVKLASENPVITCHYGHYLNLHRPNYSWWRAGGTIVSCRKELCCPLDLFFCAQCYSRSVVRDSHKFEYGVTFKPGSERHFHDARGLRTCEWSLMARTACVQISWSANDLMLVE